MKKIIIFSMILFVFIVECEKATSPGVPSKIYGTVRDPDGNTVADAKILVNFHIDADYPIGNKNGLYENYFLTLKDSFIPDPPPPPPIDYGIKQNCPNPFINLTGIDFCLSNCGCGSLWIEDIFSNEIKILIDNEIFLGDIQYSITWDGKNNDNMDIQNGTYKVILQTEEEIYNDTLFVLKDYEDFTYDDIALLCISNDSGQFMIFTRNLPLNYVGDQCDCDGNLLGDFTVTRYVDIWAFHADYSPVHIDSVLVESGQEMNVSLTFE